jgi:N-acetylneuraminic acid mutarotase
MARFHSPSRASLATNCVKIVALTRSQKIRYSRVINTTFLCNFRCISDKYKMKRALVFLFLFFNVVKAQTWQQLTDLPGGARDDGAAFVINDKAYCGSGLAAGFGTTIDFYCLDLTTNSWTNTASMPAGKERQYACGFTNGTYGFIFGGESGGVDFNDCLRYNTATNTWSVMASRPGNGVRGAACFVLGNMAYIIGGAFGTTDALNEVWAYDMGNNTWTQKNNMPFNCWRSAATAVSGKGYLLFGRDVNGRFKKELYEYDPIADQWTLINNFPNKGRAYSTLQNINNELVVFAGYDTLDTYYNDVWVYNISSSAWTQKTSLPSFGRKGGMCFTNNNDLYYTTGIEVTNTRLKETWKATFAVGIEEFEKGNEFIKVFPDPAKDVLYIDSSKLNGFRYTITDLLGRVVQENELQNSSISIENLDKGLYQLSIICIEKRFRSKFIIE